MLNYFQFFYNLFVWCTTFAIPYYSSATAQVLLRLGRRPRYYPWAKCLLSVCPSVRLSDLSVCQTRELKETSAKILIPCRRRQTRGNIRTASDHRMVFRSSQESEITAGNPRVKYVVPLCLPTVGQLVRYWNEPCYN